MSRQQGLASTELVTLGNTAFPLRRRARWQRSTGQRGDRPQAATVRQRGTRRSSPGSNSQASSQELSNPFTRVAASACKVSSSGTVPAMMTADANE
ncbi:MAG: hypothetical protein ACRDRF_09745 [Pseudonocardiaceae bacterium]